LSTVCLGIYGLSKVNLTCETLNKITYTTSVRA